MGELLSKTNLELIYNRMKEKYPDLYRVFTGIEHKTQDTNKCQILTEKAFVPHDCKIDGTTVIDNFLEKLNNSFLNNYKKFFYVFSDDGFGSRKLRCTWNNDHYQILTDVGFG